MAVNQPWAWETHVAGSRLFSIQYVLYSLEAFRPVTVTTEQFNVFVMLLLQKQSDLERRLQRKT